MRMLFSKLIEKLFEQLKSYFNKNNIEVIFINDGSTDSSLKILNKLKGKINVN